MFQKSLKQQKIISVEGPFNIFIWINALKKVLMLHVHISMFKFKKKCPIHKKWDTQSDVMKEKVDHLLYSSKMFHQKCIIMPTESSNSSVPEESIYTIVRTPQCFINQGNETRFFSMQQSN